jgi:hypothetical protein
VHGSTSHGCGQKKAGAGGRRRAGAALLGFRSRPGGAARLDSRARAWRLAPGRRRRRPGVGIHHRACMAWSVLAAVFRHGASWGDKATGRQHGASARRRGRQGGLGVDACLGRGRRGQRRRREAGRGARGKAARRGAGRHIVVRGQWRAQHRLGAEWGADGAGWSKEAGAGRAPGPPRGGRTGACVTGGRGFGTSSGGQETYQAFVALMHSHEPATPRAGGHAPPRGWRGRARASRAARAGAAPQRGACVQSARRWRLRSSVLGGEGKSETPFLRVVMAAWS